MYKGRTVKLWDCKRCKHIWADRLGRKPIRCANCGSIHYETVRKSKVMTEARKENG